MIDYNDLRITDFVTKDNLVHFSSYKAGYFWYIVKNLTDGQMYCFPIDRMDIGTAELLHTDKSIYYMRYIRKAIAEKTLREEECSI